MYWIYEKVRQDNNWSNVLKIWKRTYSIVAISEDPELIESLFQDLQKTIRNRALWILSIDFLIEEKLWFDFKKSIDRIWKIFGYNWVNEVREKINKLILNKDKDYKDKYDELFLYIQDKIDLIDNLK